jgi:subtilisin family serine protease
MLRIFYFSYHWQGASHGGWCMSEVSNAGWKFFSGLKSSGTLRASVVLTSAALLSAAGVSFASENQPKLSGKNISYDSKGNPYVKGQYLVKVKTKANYEKFLSTVNQEIGLFSSRQPILETSSGTWYKFENLTPENDEASGLKFLSLSQNEDGIELVEPNYIYTTMLGRGPKPAPVKGGPDILPEPPLGSPSADPELSKMYGLAKVDAPAAWKISKGSKDILVANIDTGVDYNHPDLANNVWRNSKEIDGDGIDNDRNGYIDDVVGYDFRDKDGRPFDDNSHGSHTFGTIAATGNNGVGVSGVSQVASVMSLRFLGGAQGSGTLEGAIGAIGYATKMGARIMSNSWGGGGYSQALFDAVAGAKNILFVAAAGNSGANNDTAETYPANFKLPTVLSVSATDSSDRLAVFSNFGSKTVHVAAPGVSIFSTLPNGRYGALSGTSMACPHVSGAAALILSKNSKLSALELKKVIMESADPISGLDGSSITGGRLNVERALEIASKL